MTKRQKTIENSVPQAPPEDTATLNLKITEQIDGIIIGIGKFLVFNGQYVVLKLSKDAWMHQYGEWTSRKDYDEDEDPEPGEHPEEKTYLGPTGGMANEYEPVFLLQAMSRREQPAGLQSRHLWAV